MFEPEALIARLAALIPRPRAKMSRFFGVFASAHPWRSRVVPRPPCPKKTGRPVAPKRPARMGWADRMKRVFKIDVHRCPYCGGRLRFVAVIFDPTAI
ncbi:MAG: IS91 family transposase, partial [bacterium]|nr:IS91 family transposase [bacterium]